MTHTNPAQCKVCSSKSLSWFASQTINTGVQQGRLNTADVACVFVLGCDECSETLAVVPADKIASELNTRLTSASEPVGYTSKPALSLYLNSDYPSLAVVKQVYNNWDIPVYTTPQPAQVGGREELAETIFRAHWPNDSRPWEASDDGSPQEYQKAFLRAADAVLALINPMQEKSDVADTK